MQQEKIINTMDCQMDLLEIRRKTIYRLNYRQLLKIKATKLMAHADNIKLELLLQLLK